MKEAKRVIDKWLDKQSIWQINLNDNDMESFNSRITSSEERKLTPRFNAANV